jgi:phosphate starvation-inducible PhoH-like protein
LDTTAVRVDITLKPEDNHRLASLYGQLDENLRQIETRLNVKISCRGPQVSIFGDELQANKAKLLMQRLYQETLDHEITPDRVHLCLQELSFMHECNEDPEQGGSLHTNRGMIKPRSPNQNLYLRNINNYDINFGIGPAGTGKSYLAVATAIHALEHDKVRRIILVRPAVEAGESLGFLPGDLEQKIDPYLRPLYDALYELMGFERVHQLLERSVIEVAPLAYMRGRTLNDSFIILDESQNTTIEQMKMFLTRIGFNSTAVITGDITQIDLPRGKRSGLKHVMEVLKDIKGISFTFFNAADVVRHPLVQKIVEAYHKHEQENDEHRH